ncbi:hypothetical protein KO507_09840 [Gilvimarinus agarilyticus]|uniref:hypothetical protein n=1 Tax=Reichenbachiella TaxID=156993 RepID=UPI000E6D508B|nr:MULTISPECIES: hypothetical protein [Reichenbachiella]MBU2886061.1 hypothetical protein [Gilvimarinus agarilyticus]MBU2913535.1 hypothetical protein [Reichenbachiella agariperforans]RJE74499.1 hypothetical protein BGP76_15225 [Reichenbachiella sp. MSK19-1]
MHRLTVLLLLLWSSAAIAQEQLPAMTEKVWRVNFINPAIELEIPTGQRSTISYGVGVGFTSNTGYLGSRGFVYELAPFFDTQYKLFYSLNRRYTNGKSIRGNSANFISGRVLIVGNSLKSNFYQYDRLYFGLGPTWGIQRSIGKVHVLFDVGPQFVVDIEGRNGWFPLMLQLNIGLNL